MNKLSPVMQFALVAAVCFLTLGMFYNFYYKPKQDVLTTMRTDLETKQRTAADYRAKVAQIPQLKEQVAKLEVERAEFVRALPTNQQFGQVLAQLRSAASATKTDITSLNFSNGTTTTDVPAGVRPINIDLAVKGSYGAIHQLLRTVETQNRFTTVNNVDLQLQKAESFDPDLQGTLKLTVYTFDPNMAAAPATTPGTPGSTATPGSAAAPAPAAPAPATGGQP